MEFPVSKLFHDFWNWQEPIISFDENWLSHLIPLLSRFHTLAKKTQISLSKQKIIKKIRIFYVSIVTMISFNFQTINLQICQYRRIPPIFRLRFLEWNGQPLHVFFTFRNHKFECVLHWNLYPFPRRKLALALKRVNWATGGAPKNCSWAKTHWTKLSKSKSWFINKWKPKVRIVSKTWVLCYCVIRLLLTYWTKPRKFQWKRDKKPKL